MQPHLAAATLGRRRQRWSTAVAALTLVVTAIAAVPAAGATATAAAVDPPAEVSFIGEASSATGAALAGGSCDVNGDGYGDVIAGAWFWDKLPTNSNEGAAYVLLGGPEPVDVDLANPDDRFVQLDGESAGDLTAFSVGCGGDVNGDGYDDVLIGNYIRETVYVVFGRPDFGSLDLGYLGDGGFRIQGSLTLDQNVGYAVVGLGDIDGDSLDDIGVAAVVADTQGRNNNGRVYVVPGQKSTATVDVTDDAASIMILEGSQAEERLGSLAPAGDVTGDGRPDIVVGSYTATPHGAAVPVAGAAWVVGGTSRGIVDLAEPLDVGFEIVGPERARDRLGISVSGIGDVDGDGIGDVIVGGDGVTNAATGPRTGSAWVIFGSASNETVNAGEVEATGRGYWIQGAAQADSFGFSVAGIGDVNGDGTPDALVGAYGFDPANPDNPATTMSNAGALYVVYGKTGSAPLSVAGIAPETGFRVDGRGPGDRFGRQVAAVGDFDANHGADFAGAGDFAVRQGRTQAGEVRVFFGPPGTPTGLAPAAPAVVSPDLLVPTPAGAVVTTLRCPAATAGCDGSLALRNGAVAVPFSLAAGEVEDVAVALQARSVSNLAQRGRLDDRVTVTATGPRGRTLEVEQRVILLAEVKVPEPMRIPARAGITASHAVGRWQPTSFDTCPVDLHDRFEVIASDGKRYPTWHPASVVNPATGEPCTFGHEHGPDPRGSNIYQWVAHQFAHPSFQGAAGIPFGFAGEALDGAVAADPSLTPRHEDHVGHKIDYANDVALLDTGGNPLGVTCDYLFKLHQGTHSPDALSNNVHELIYAMQCSDGTAVLSTTLVPFGAPGEYQSSCAPNTTRSAGTTPGYPSGGGGRLIPDRACIESQILVPASRGSAFWAIYENWQADTGLGDGDLVAYDADFAVFNPSRYAAGDGTTTIARVLDTCWEVEANGDTANRRPCPDETDGEPFFCTWDDPRSPFDGAYRELFIGQTTIRNAGGPTVWYTDPFGGNPSTTAFPGSIRQHVASVDNSDRPEVARRLFGRGTAPDYYGVHAPN